MSGPATLVIAGVGKAGTTSLFWYLSQHPEICASRVKEIRHFEPLAFGEQATSPQGYEQHFRHCTDQRYRLEASPQYFHGGPPVVEAIASTLERPHVIVMLRDPIERLWSTYHFMRSRMADLPQGMTFDDYVARCREVRVRREPLTRENVRYWTVQGGFYDEHLGPWVDRFGEDLRIVFTEHLAARPGVEVEELCRWLGIDETVASTFTYSVENRTVEFRSATLQRIALALNSERLLGRRRRLKEPLRRLYYAVNRRRASEEMQPSTREALSKLFMPGNAALARRLGELGYRDLPAWLERA